METKFLTSLEPAISSARLVPYQNASANDLEVLVAYFHNLALSEALYAPLCCLEVSLRNSLNEALRVYLGTTTWYNQPGLFGANQAADIHKAKKRATPRSAPAGFQPSPGKVIAELNFGFWTSLLSRDYEASLWRPNRARLLKSTFRYIPTSLRQRNTVYSYFNRFRELRNRVFHHESIWNRPSLAKDHQDIIEAIGWMSPPMKRALAVVDHFDDRYRNGRTSIEADIKRELGLQ